MHTQRSIKPLLLAAVGAALLLADLAPGGLTGWRILPEAQAIIGRPLTPMSYAGVARRTTARVVTAETVAVTTAVASEQQAAVAQQQAAMAQQQAAVAQQQAAATRPAVGTVVQALPAGCAQEAIGGVEYQRCAGVYYRAAFQGNNLVYVVQQP